MELGNVKTVSIVDEMTGAYLDYSMSVIVSRALPDVRDGLKPVHRRVLFAMHEANITFNRPYVKCARVVGDVMGKYHPHGDTAIYDALVRMAQDFSMRAPLVDGQGNFGSVDGDLPAAMRYTEVRMSRLASELLADIEKDTVDFTPNYDESEHEPSVLPTRVPNLLINGQTGIAVGMATNIPPHNLIETVNACIALLDDPSLPLAALMQHMPGPDFPTGGIINGAQEIATAYRTGRGRLSVRARASIEEVGKGDRQAIVVTELPYQVNKARLIERIAELVNNKTIEDISDIRDESNREGVRVVIDLKRDATPDVVLVEPWLAGQGLDLTSFSRLLLEEHGVDVLHDGKPVPSQPQLPPSSASRVPPSPVATSIPQSLIPAPMNSSARRTGKRAATSPSSAKRSPSIPGWRRQSSINARLSGRSRGKFPRIASRFGCWPGGRSGRGRMLGPGPACRGASASRPPTGASISTVAFSVSISASKSPALATRRSPENTAPARISA